MKYTKLKFYGFPSKYVELYFMKWKYNNISKKNYVSFFLKK
jgi:hypothetical protein